MGRVLENEPLWYQKGARRRSRHYPTIQLAEYMTTFPSHLTKSSVSSCHEQTLISLIEVQPALRPIFHRR